MGRAERVKDGIGRYADSWLDETQPVINKRLLEKYGTQFDGRPHFRLVWSENQRVKRLGEYDDYYGSGPGKIYLRTVVEIREVPKWRFIKDRWIIERLLPKLEVYSNEEIFEPAKQKGYWCIYVFEASEKYGYAPLKVIWPVIERVCNAALEKKVTIKPGDVKTWHNEQLDKDAKRMLEEDLEAPSDLAYGGGISMFGQSSKHD